MQKKIINPRPLDYLKFYDLEQYLFTEVSGRFARTRKISPEDFYMIIIWKANRAKTRIRNRLSKHENGFAGAVEELVASLEKCTQPMEKIEILMKEWGFRLPMVTAILTVLYPDEFSIYDVRICEQLGEFSELADRHYSESLWEEYQSYLKLVRSSAPRGLSQRDKDRFLSGLSFYESVVRDLQFQEGPERDTEPLAPSRPNALPGL